MSEEISDETLVTVLQARGYDVTKREAEQARPAQPETPEQQLLDHLNRSLTPWHILGGNDAA